MPKHSLPRKLFTLLLVIALLSMRLATLTDEAFVVPIEDAIFHVAFIAGDDRPTHSHPLKVKDKGVFDIVLIPIEGLPPQVEPVQKTTIPDLTGLVLRDITAEIFIPPEVFS